MCEYICEYVYRKRFQQRRHSLLFKIFFPFMFRIDPSRQRLVKLIECFWISVNFREFLWIFWTSMNILTGTFDNIHQNNEYSQYSQIFTRSNQLSDIWKMQPAFWEVFLLAIDSFSSKEISKLYLIEISPKTKGKLFHLKAIESTNITK